MNRMVTKDYRKGVYERVVRPEARKERIGSIRRDFRTLVAQGSKGLICNPPAPCRMSNLGNNNKTRIRVRSLADADETCANAIKGQTAYPRHPSCGWPFHYT